MLKIVLTGGITSGKSTAAKYFAGLGAATIDADEIAKDFTQLGTPAHKKIIAHFGPEIYKSGIIDRKTLREIIYSDPKERVWLENLLHPLIYKKMRQELEQVKSPYSILIIPLFVETKVEGFKSLADRVLVIDVKKSEQISRLQKRYLIDTAAAKKIISNQAKRKIRLEIADDIIDNNYSLPKLRQQVIALHDKYKKFGIKSSI